MNVKNIVINMNGLKEIKSRLDSLEIVISHLKVDIDDLFNKINKLCK